MERQTYKFDAFWEILKEHQTLVSTPTLFLTRKRYAFRLYTSIIHSWPALHDHTHRRISKRTEIEKMKRNPSFKDKKMTHLQQ